MRGQVFQKLPLKDARGQAMVEYTFVTHVLLIGGTFALWGFSTYLMKGLSLFYENIYWVLTSSVP